MPESPEPNIYQLRVVLLGISPIIWRRLLVSGGAPALAIARNFKIALGRAIARDLVPDRNITLALDRYLRS
jgi:hypothetical protein